MTSFHDRRTCGRATAILAASLAFVPPLRADVTVVEETTVNAAIIRMHLNATERTTRDKQRRDSDGKMDGMLSLLGNMRSGDIIRLDRNLEWRLEPDKRKYLETLFPTPQQRAGAAEDARDARQDEAVSGWPDAGGAGGRSRLREDDAAVRGGEER